MQRASPLTPHPQEDLALDPLAVLRCDERVFRVAPLLSILLYMLKACLAASRTRLNQCLQAGKNKIKYFINIYE